MARVVDDEARPLRRLLGRVPEEEKVKCKCGALMMLLFVWDDAQETDHCFNVFACDECGRVLYDSVWENARRLWIHLDKEQTEDA